MHIPSMTAIKGVFKHCAHDPRANCPLKSVVDMANPEYSKMRAIECIQENQIELAIFLLGLSVVQDEIAKT